MDLSTKTTILLDGDGVLWKADTALDGIKEFFAFMEEKNINWALLTNNSVRTAEDYLNKFRQFGIKADKSKIFTCSLVAAKYLKDKYGMDARVHVVGMPGLTQTLTEAGFQFSLGEEIPRQSVDAVVAGMDREINHEKIKIAMRLIRGGAEFIATNTDCAYPAPDGISPGTGMVIAALQVTSETEPIVMGKPETAIFETALHYFKEKPENALMVGDRLETDILGANRMGITSVAVLTGITSREQIDSGDIKPDLIVDDISNLHSLLEEAYA